MTESAEVAVPQGRPTAWALLAPGLLLAVTVWVYWPGIDGPALLDDRSSVLVIKNLKDSPELARDYIFGDRSGLLGRSVSMATFVLEKMYLDEGIRGGKMVNILLHAFNGGLVIWLFWLLLRQQDIPGYRAIAVICGGLWLLHPLLVSSVLYVVQRMAMLATTFMLLSLISYIYCRLSVQAGRRGAWAWLFAVLAFFLLGMFSKENAIVVIPVILLLEVLWLRCRGAGGVTLTWLRNLSYGLIAGGTAVLFGILVFGWDSLAARLSRRPFTLAERLMSESRIVWDYVGQLLWPELDRMGLYQDDVAISRSFTEPVTTLYATAGWALVLLVGIVLLRWQLGRWLVLAMAIFLVGHSVESTVLSLELYFEHRNYFPAIGMALGVAVLLAALLRRAPQAQVPLNLLLTMLLVVLSAATASQVQVWSKRSVLVLQNVSGHPESPRANIDMATELASAGALDKALVYSKRAYENSLTERLGDHEARDLALACMARKPVPPEAIDGFAARDERRPLSSVTTLLTLVRMLQADACPEFDRQRLADRMKVLYLDDPNVRKGKPNIYANLAVLENTLGRYDYAYAYTERFLIMAPRHKRGLLMKLHFATALRDTAAVNEVRTVLEEMDAKGQLNVREQQTLALYLEN
ncbi:MAG: hypothetical protein HKN19_00770 [Halioglobus sp.]|nr:hypothetical protein [Halioglobus sp.]